MGYNDTDPDPLAGGVSRPSVSFKDKPVGTVIEGEVTEAPKLVDARDFETGELAKWPDGNQKKTIVVGLLVDGEEVSLWAPVPSAMKAALFEAQGKAGKGVRITEGGKLAVKFVGEKPNAKNPRLNAQKLYAAIYTPPVAPDPVADPFGESAPF